MKITSGFTTWKDVLDIVFMPITVTLLAIFLPSYLESVKQDERRSSFEMIISREFSEIEPQPEEVINKVEGDEWHDHLKKNDFVHKRILDDASGNRDFLLSIDSDKIYYLNQLWAHMTRAKDSETPDRDHALIAERWIYYYCRLCDSIEDGGECKGTLKNWEGVFRAYGLDTLKANEKCVCKRAGLGEC